MRRLLDASVLVAAFSRESSSAQALALMTRSLSEIGRRG